MTHSGRFPKKKDGVASGVFASVDTPVSPEFFKTINTNNYVWDQSIPKIYFLILNANSPVIKNPGFQSILEVDEQTRRRNSVWLTNKPGFYRFQT